MSAIAGIYDARERPVSSADIEMMSERLAHRGADAVQAWGTGNIRLAQRLLRTTPEAAHEKIASIEKGGPLVIVADARIDNRDELLKALLIKERPAQQISDNEIILRAYRQWGEDCPKRLLGDFAFAIWDGYRRRLFCARDHFGVRQFYYHATDGLFVFATEIKALFCLPRVPQDLNEARIADYLLLAIEDKRETLYREVFKLRPGHALIVNRDGLREQSYWSPDPTREVRYRTDAEYGEAYLSHFREAVGCRLRSTNSVGSALSGGLDSSAIACMAREIYRRRGGERLKTFSAIYTEVPECDERYYIDSVLAEGGIEPFYAPAERHSPLTYWGDLIERDDEPLWNPQMALHWALYETACDAGASVFLDGFAGDAVTSHGVAYLNELASTGHWIRWVKEARRYSERVGQPFRHLLKWRGLLPLIPDFVWRARRAFASDDPLQEQLGGVPLSPDFIVRINLKERLAAARAAESTPVRNSRHHHARQLTAGLWSFSLGIDDRVTALFGIERRHPFLDLRLVEFCLALPPEQKMRQGWTRRIARLSLSKILPERIQRRVGKTNHSLNFNHQLVTSDSRILEKVIFDPPEAIKRYIDIASLHRLYYRYLSHGKNSDGFILWRVVKMAVWLECLAANRSGRGNLKTMMSDVNDGRAVRTVANHRVA